MYNLAQITSQEVKPETSPEGEQCDLSYCMRVLQVPLKVINFHIDHRFPS